MKTVVPERELKTATITIPTVIVFGDRDAKQQVLSSLEVYNLYQGGLMNVIDGEGILRP